ncbi:MAG: glycosyltransferase [Candidatus Lokiarchaeota archaeon]|nr:glycosyltransferase [Candidatus Harpocratesius repetitus]
MKKKKPYLSVIFLTYFSPLNYIKKNIILLGCKDVEYIFIDNSNNKSYSNKLKKMLNHFIINCDFNYKIIFSENNGGYSKGNNLGVRLSSGEYILILNPDIELEKDFYSKFCLYRNIYNWDIITPLILENKYNKKMILGISYIIGYSLFNFIYKIRRKLHKKLYYNQFISGSCFLIKKDVFLELGGFDITYFMYLEDLDFSLRAIKRKKKILFSKDFVVYHHHEKFSTLSRIQTAKNIPLLIRKNFNRQYNLQNFLSIFRVFCMLFDSSNQYKIRYREIIPLFRTFFAHYLFYLTKR